MISNLAHIRIFYLEYDFNESNNFNSLKIVLFSKSMNPPNELKQQLLKILGSILDKILYKKDSLT